MVTLFSIIFTFADFDIVWVLTRGGPTNSTHLFATLAYQTGLVSANIGEGAAIALFLFPVLVITVIVQTAFHPEGIGVTVLKFQQFAKRALWLYVPIMMFLVFILLPFYWMLITALKQDRNIFDPDANPFWFSMAPTLAHFWDLINPDKTDFLIWIQNSFMVAGLVTFISVSIGIMAGYSLARLRYKGAETIGSSVFVTYLVPPSLLFLPLSHVIDQLNLMETRWALIVSYPTFLVPFCTWLLMGYFRTIPKEIEECAMVDGCSRIKTLFKIVLPVAIPGIVTAALFFLYPVVG